MVWIVSIYIRDFMDILIYLEAALVHVFIVSLNSTAYSVVFSLLSALFVWIVKHCYQTIQGPVYRFVTSGRKLRHKLGICA